MVKKAAQATPNHLLRRARKERGWTQQHVADLIGAPLGLNITRWERGTAIPSAYYTQRLCELFGQNARGLGLLALEEEDRSNADLLWMVPYRRNPFFTGRERILALLEQVLLREEGAVPTSSLALSGLGGIGKTQLAVEYAYRCRDQYQAVFWVSAASRETLLADFSALAHLLALPEYKAQEQQLMVEAVQRWLIQNPEWLLILDNADELAVVENFVPRTEQGHVLLTTRAQATGKLAVRVEVEKMDLQESLLLLLRRSKRLALDESPSCLDAGTLNIAQTLARALDGLPLALNQAAAYIEESGCSLRDYLELYEKHRMALFERASMALSEYPSTIANTWSLSFQKVAKANPAAAELLRLCAFLDADAIPEVMLDVVFGDALERNEALSVLRQYSLIRRDPDANLLSIHRLVQAVIQAEMDEPTRRVWAERTMLLVHAALPEPAFENWVRCQECLPHALACAHLIEMYHFVSSEAVQLLDRAGMYLQQRALYPQAVSLLSTALQICEQEHGSDCLDTATMLDHLALVYSDQGEYTQAESRYQRALTIRKRILGEEHPDIAITLFNLGWLYYLQGKYQLAEGAAQQALHMRENVLGEQHWDTIDVFSDLALIYIAEGKYEPAEPLLIQALAFYERTIGPAHIIIAKALHNLALLYTAWGKHKQAQQLFRRALAVHKKTVGPEHPNFANTLTNLGQVCLALEQYKRAEILHKCALTIFEKVVGPEHPDTAMTLAHLAQVYHRQDCYEQAEPLYLRALTIREQKLGPEHPKTVDTLYLLSNLRDGRDRLLRGLGINHPDGACQTCTVLSEVPDDRDLPSGDQATQSA